MPKFLPGVSGNPRGRPKGPNTITREVRELARELVEAPDYRQELRARLVSGKLPAAIEALMWAYAYGRPTETITITDELSPLVVKIVEGPYGDDTHDVPVQRG